MLTAWLGTVLSAFITHVIESSQFYQIDNFIGDGPRVLVHSNIQKNLMSYSFIFALFQPKFKFNSNSTVLLFLIIFITAEFPYLLSLLKDHYMPFYCLPTL